MQACLAKPGLAHSAHEPCSPCPLNSPTLLPLPTQLINPACRRARWCSWLPPSRWWRSSHSPLLNPAHLPALLPQGKVVFMAPTKPLVAQQVDACHSFMGMSKAGFCEITGGRACQDQLGV